MNLNVHPIVVHFPIALLTIYALMELVRFKKIAGQPYWFYVKATFVILGSLASVVAYETGKWAARAIRSDLSLRPILRLHETYASLTIVIFGVLAVAYFVAWMETTGYFKNWDFGLWKLAVWLKNLILQAPLAITLALLGLVVITITGALGGTLVYGPNIDPVVKLVNQILVK